VKGTFGLMGIVVGFIRLLVVPPLVLPLVRLVCLL